MTVRSLFDPSRLAERDFDADTVRDEPDASFAPSKSSTHR